VFIHDSWLRLDFNKDGKVSQEDLKRTAQDFIHFLQEFEYLEEAYKIKNKLYQQAIRYMQKEIDESRKRESRSDEVEEPVRIN